MDWVPDGAVAELLDARMVEAAWLAVPACVLRDDGGLGTHATGEVPLSPATSQPQRHE